MGSMVASLSMACVLACFVLPRVESANLVVWPTALIQAPAGQRRGCAVLTSGWAQGPWALGRVASRTAVRACAGRGAAGPLGSTPLGVESEDTVQIPQKKDG